MAKSIRKSKLLMVIVRIHKISNLVYRRLSAISGIPFYSAPHVLMTFIPQVLIIHLIKKCCIATYRGKNQQQYVQQRFPSQARKISLRWNVSFHKVNVIGQTVLRSKQLKQLLGMLTNYELNPMHAYSVVV